MATEITVTTPAPNQVLVTVSAAKDAYQLAVDAGFEGTREEWLESFAIPSGLSGISSITIADGKLTLVIGETTYYAPLFEQP